MQVQFGKIRLLRLKKSREISNTDEWGTVNMDKRDGFDSDIECLKVMAASIRKNPPAELNELGEERERTKQAQNLLRRF